MKKLVIVLSLVMFGAIAQADDIRPGLWKISLESSVAASPDFKPQPYETTQCLTEADAKNPDHLLVGMGSSGVSGCEFQNRQDSGSSVKFDVVCAGALGIKGHGEVNYSATALDGTLNLNMGEAEKVDMANKIHATYQGECQSKGAGM